MYRTVFMALAILLNLVLCVNQSLGRPPSVEEILQYLREPAGTVETPLEQIAVAAYDVLIHLPFTGLQAQHTELEQLIEIKRALIEDGGFLERLLALRMQEAIDCAILFEVNRRAHARNGETLSPPYNSRSVQDATVTSLLELNGMEEIGQIEYILHLDGEFAQFFRNKGFDVDDVLKGKVPRKLSPELWAKSTNDIFGGYLGGRKKLTRKIVQDMLFIYTLQVLDRARDVRILWDVFRRYDDFYISRSSVTNTGAIDKVLRSWPYRRRTDENRRNSGARVSMTGVNYASPHPHSYLTEMTGFFFSYFSDVYAIAARHDGIFSWYHETGGGSYLHGQTGLWLELTDE